MVNVSRPAPHAPHLSPVQVADEVLNVVVCDIPTPIFSALPVLPLVDYQTRSLLCGEKWSAWMFRTTLILVSRLLLFLLFLIIPPSAIPFAPLPSSFILSRVPELTYQAVDANSPFLADQKVSTAALSRMLQQSTVFRASVSSNLVSEASISSVMLVFRYRCLGHSFFSFLD